MTFREWLQTENGTMSGGGTGTGDIAGFRRMVFGNASQRMYPELITMKINNEEAASCNRCHEHPRQAHTHFCKKCEIIVYGKDGRKKMDKE